MIVWIIGLSGAGKSTLSKQVIEEARGRGRTVVLLDGDSLRDLFGNDLGHSLEDRRVNAHRICRMCAFFDDQGIDVVCAVQSLFLEFREWCRNNLSSYYEVFIEAPLDQLIKRDVKGIYARHLRGEIKNVAGLDLDFPGPINSDLIISNSGTKEAFLDFVPTIVDQICME